MAYDHDEVKLLPKPEYTSSNTVQPAQDHAIADERINHTGSASLFGICGGIVRRNPTELDLCNYSRDYTGIALVASLKYQEILLKHRAPSSNRLSLTVNVNRHFPIFGHGQRVEEAFLSCSLVTRQVISQRVGQAFRKLVLGQSQLFQINSARGPG